MKRRGLAYEWRMWASSVLLGLALDVAPKDEQVRIAQWLLPYTKEKILEGR